MQRYRNATLCNATGDMMKCPKCGFRMERDPEQDFECWLCGKVVSKLVLTKEDGFSHKGGFMPRVASGCRYGLCLSCPEGDCRHG